MSMRMKKELRCFPSYSGDSANVGVLGLRIEFPSGDLCWSEVLTSRSRGQERAPGAHVRGDFSSRQVEWEREEGATIHGKRGTGATSRREASSSQVKEGVSRGSVETNGRSYLESRLLWWSRPRSRSS